ncbi:MAG TPA: PrsW family intramembrane metalloprotease [Thermoleophilaceae bacterium]|nr:PrsW family intramembrane metalloprotease [Thermoleophilaceae bacterium]
MVATRAGRSNALAGIAVALLVVCGLLTVLILAGELGPVGFAVGFVLAVLPVPVYLVLGLWIDRYEPEPPRLLAGAFLWGATGATLVALIFNTAGQMIVGAALGSEVGRLYGGSLSAPFIEEVSKVAALYAIYRWRRHEFDGVLDGIVYAGMVGLGFALTENVLYYGRAGLEGDGALAATFFVRGVLSPFAHPLFTAMTGMGLGLAALREGTGWRVASVIGLFGAMVLHSLWNTSAGLSGGLGFLGVVRAGDGPRLCVAARRGRCGDGPRALGHRPIPRAGGGERRGVARRPPGAVVAGRSAARAAGRAPAGARRAAGAQGAPARGDRARLPAPPPRTPPAP